MGESGIFVRVKIEKRQKNHKKYLKQTVVGHSDRIVGMFGGGNDSSGPAVDCAAVCESVRG
jgi:hypothetical protein